MLQYGFPKPEIGGHGFPKPKIGGFAIPKIVNYQSLSLNKTGLDFIQNFANLNELDSFIFDHNPTLSWKRGFYLKKSK